MKQKLTGQPAGNQSSQTAKAKPALWSVSCLFESAQFPSVSGQALQQTGAVTEHHSSYLHLTSGVLLYGKNLLDT